MSDERSSADARTMLAVRLRDPGGLEGLTLEQIEVPPLRDGEARIRVHAAAITRGELEWPLDRLPAIPSYELSGVVDAAPDADGVSVGDAVFALTAFDRDGVASDYATVATELLAAKPRTLDHLESAAVPLAALSAWQALFDHGGLGEGQRVLVQGAAGGVGHFAVQLARRFGAYVIGSTSRSKMESARSVGAHEVLEHTASGLAEALELVDLVLDTVGGELLARSPAVVSQGGKVVSIAEPPPDGVDGAYFVVEPNREQLVEVARLVDEGGLRPAIDSVFPLADARAAFERSMSSGTSGKVVLRVVDD